MALVILSSRLPSVVVEEVELSDVAVVVVTVEDMDVDVVVISPSFLFPHPAKTNETATISADNAIIVFFIATVSFSFFLFFLVLKFLFVLQHNKL